MYTYYFFIHVCWGVNNRDAAEGTDASCHIHIPKVNSAWWETNVSICTANMVHQVSIRRTVQAIVDNS